MALPTPAPIASARARRQAALTHGLAAAAPLMTLLLVLLYVGRHELAVDFRYEYWAAGQRLLHGHNLYDWSQTQIAAGVAFPYPAAAAVLFAPFALLPQMVSAAVFVTLLMAAVAATLWVLSVRDWRVYAVAFLLWPVINGWQTSNLTLVLGLLVALAWRHRDRPALAGLLVALMISLKPLAWPLLLWLVVTRRWRAALWSALSGLLINAAAWALVGYHQIGGYLHLDHRVTATLYRTGYSLVAIVARFGGGEAVGLTVLILASAPLAAAALWLGSRGRERAALTAVMALTLVASPLVWNHYFALMLVPLAIARPRLSGEWLAALVLWLCPATHVAQWQALLFTAVTVGIAWRLTGLTPDRPSRSGQIGAEASRPGPG